jgi:hypothetical protein
MYPQKHFSSRRLWSTVANVVNQSLCYFVGKGQLKTVRRLSLRERDVRAIPAEVVEGKVADVTGTHPQSTRQEDDCEVAFPDRGRAVDGTKDGVDVAFAPDSGNSRVWANPYLWDEV